MLMQEEIALTPQSKAAEMRGVLKMTVPVVYLKTPQCKIQPIHGTTVRDKPSTLQSEKTKRQLQQSSCLNDVPISWNVGMTFSTQHMITDDIIRLTRQLSNVATQQLQII
jgi:hypothetical protein